MTARPLLSVIVATRNDEATLGLLISDLGRLTVPHEVIVVDGGSTDFTAAVARTAGARMPQGPVGPGRSSQLRAGAGAARAPLLLFLNPHVLLDTIALRLLLEASVEIPPRGRARPRLRRVRSWVHLIRYLVGTSAPPPLNGARS